MAGKLKGDIAAVVGENNVTDSLFERKDSTTTI